MSDKEFNLDESEQPGAAKASRNAVSRRALLKTAGATILASAGLMALKSSQWPDSVEAATSVNSYYDVIDYGAVGDGTTDDRAAIQAAINAAQGDGGGVVFLPKGNYAVSSTLNITGHNVGICGVGGASVIKGTFAAGNIIYFGGTTPGAGTINNFFRDFTITSGVVKTSGAALYGQHAQRSCIEGLKADDPGASGYNLYDGIVFNSFDNCLVSNVQLFCSHAGLIAYGKSDQSWGANLWFTNGSRIHTDYRPGSIGIHLGGSCGGIAIEASDIIGCETNVRINTALSGAQNREILFNECFIDSAGNHGVHIQSNGVALLHFNNTWVASSGSKASGGYPNGSNIQHENTSAGLNDIIVSGCRVFNAWGSGIYAKGGRWTITGSSFHNNGRGTAGGHGIMLTDSTVKGANITGNTICDNGNGILGQGIRIHSGVNNYIITSNVVRANATAQISDGGSANKVVTNNLTS
ncbi:right-handed parallel beta-helix repeat-containing protein [Paenibacillus sp. PAMC21692]|uniref:right-handed parallel beta-helix repeat-containing protein n=1 Tax=Paenibacillus sp. PAMC21692 TaxID=2762320 RepID=UPI00164EC63C|nr:right-handed parallel beta-helix repeat-containing protein [Paenibacillus sp. PAMC21692]QNK57259.1 right-handed parallel beta-helix repeat-containing protein [Paenibacillus sp. PAMC21692]